MILILYKFLYAKKIIIINFYLKILFFKIQFKSKINFLCKSNNLFLFIIAIYHNFLFILLLIIGFRNWKPQNVT
jgi:hypothetical protein